jgi:hypothetical protein
MMYAPGDYVCPADLPRRFLCRVVGAESFHVSSGESQILKLEPLEGPWPSGTCLIRLGGAVVPARTRELSRTRKLMRFAACDRPMLGRARLTAGRRIVA